MTEPPAKKAKTEATLEELEKDAATSGPKIKETPVFHVEDTTMNVMPSSFGTMLMPLSDGGLQYLLAGARASVGLKSGRYAFEVKLLEVMSPLEDANARTRMATARCQLRVGFSTAASSLFLGETKDSACFDSEGFFTYEKRRTQVTTQKLSSGDVVAVVLNLEKDSPNAQTLSLFKNGARLCPPQPLPEQLKGQALFPTLTFRNVTVHYNFGPQLLAPLPFVCRSIKEAAVKDAVLRPAIPAPKDGKYEALFPICLPDEGGFDWLDLFLSKNPQYTEISDRALLNWAEKSGISRPKGYGAAARSSNDKPEMGFGIQSLDDLSVRRLIQAIAPLQKRHFIVMEVRLGLIADDRIEMCNRWSGFKRVANVIVGEPPKDLKAYSQELMLKSKQEISDAEHKLKQAQEKQRWQAEKKKKEMERDKRKALKKQQRQLEMMRRKAEHAQKKKEAEAKGEAPPEEPEDPPEEEEPEEEIEPEPIEEDPPKVELSAAEKKTWFRQLAVGDLTPFLLNTLFQKFSLPEKDEGFEELRWMWQPEAKAKAHLKEWTQVRKLTSRVEDIQPGDWFSAKFKEWGKALQSFHAKQHSFKAAEGKKAMEAAAKEAKKKFKQAAREKAEKEGKELPKDEEEEEEEEDSKAEEKPKVDVEQLDVFGLDDVMDIGSGEPLFSAFAMEDWSMISLRYELHLLAHAFKRDSNDADRDAIPLEHLSFYYHKYYRKALKKEVYGCDTLEDMVDLIRDTVLVTGKNKVLEPQLPEDLESHNLFVMLTEESRRDRNRRIDMGDESARLKILTQGQKGSAPASAATNQAAAPQQQQPWQARPAQNWSGQSKGSWQDGGWGKGNNWGGGWGW